MSGPSCCLLELQDKEGEACYLANTDSDCFTNSEWNLMKTVTHTLEIPSLMADSHEFKISENGEKVCIVTGVDGIGGLIRKSCHHDPPIATKILLSPPSWHLGTNPPRGESLHLVAFTDWDKFHPKMTTLAWVNLVLLTSLLAVFEANERAGEEGETDKVQCSLRPT